MTKKKTTKKRAQPKVESHKVEPFVEITDIEEQAFLFTKLFHFVNPAIDEASAYPIVYDLITEGFGHEDVEAWGQLIRATAFDKPDDGTRH